MANPLDPIWENYTHSSGAIKVVRRCLAMASVNKPSALDNTPFAGLDDNDCLKRLDDAQNQLNDDVVLGLYARFESHVRAAVAGQHHLLHAAGGADRAFGTALGGWFERFCESGRMDEMVDLFEATVGPVRVSQIGTIRVYRHWLAHGRAWNAPPRVAPTFAYRALTNFLTAATLI